jgi:dihydrofolate reductase
MWNVITVDGYFEGVKPWDLSFHELVWGKELEKFSIEQLDSAEAIIYGANTYEGMAAYWSHEKGEVADKLLAIKKYACSISLEEASWNNTEILRDAVANIAALKQEGEGSLFVFGSGQLSSSLMKACLFDEYRLCIAPVVLGQGRQLFEDGLPTEKLTVLECKKLTENDGIFLRYETGK